jgi:TolA-binding protein
MKRILLLVIFAFLIAGCSKNSDQSLMDTAQKSANQKNYQDAIKNYNDLIKEYPDSKLIPDAMVNLASLYMSNSDSTLTEYQSYQKAADLFRQVYDKYPDSNKAPTALFMSGFVLANNLNKYDEATKTYRLFLEKFPNHQLAKSAREELNNMGISPDEILKSKSKQKKTNAS